MSKRDFRAPRWRIALYDVGEILANGLSLLAMIILPVLVATMIL